MVTQPLQDPDPFVEGQLVILAPPQRVHLTEDFKEALGNVETTGNLQKNQKHMGY